MKSTWFSNNMSLLATGQYRKYDKGVQNKKVILNVHQVNQQQKDCQPKANKYWCCENKYNGLRILSCSHSMAGRLAVMTILLRQWAWVRGTNTSSTWKNMLYHQLPQEVATSQNHWMPPQSVAIDFLWSTWSLWSLISCCEGGGRVLFQNWDQLKMSRLNHLSLVIGSWICTCFIRDRKTRKQHF